MDLMTDIEHENYPTLRPFTEDSSFVLRLTVGCSHNKCTYCDMYRQVPFTVLDDREIFEQINRAAQTDFPVRKVFLSDGDALILPTDRLLAILNKLKETFPNIESVSSFATAKNILHKTREELEKLKNVGLTLLYVGLETGSDAILKDVSKGVTSGEILETCKKIKDAGITLHVTMIIGLGGKKNSEQHISETVKLINSVRPDMISAMPLMLIRTMEMVNKFHNGEFYPLDPVEMLTETKKLVQAIDVGNNAVFFEYINYLNNYIYVKGELPADKDKIISELDRQMWFLGDQKEHDIYSFYLG